ncbi:hypothetical protein ACE6H2_000948 [Prunus campanulata]
MKSPSPRLELRDAMTFNRAPANFPYIKGLLLYMTSHTKTAIFSSLQLFLFGTNILSRILATRISTCFIPLTTTCPYSFLD